MVTLVDVGEGGSSCLQTMMLVFECLHQDMYNVDAHRAQLFLATFFAGHSTAWSLQASSIHELNLYIHYIYRGYDAVEVCVFPSFNGLYCRNTRKAGVQKHCS